MIPHLLISRFPRWNGGIVWYVTAVINEVYIELGCVVLRVLDTSWWLRFLLVLNFLRRIQIDSNETGLIRARTGYVQNQHGVCIFPPPHHSSPWPNCLYVCWHHLLQIRQRHQIYEA